MFVRSFVKLILPNSALTILNEETSTRYAAAVKWLVTSLGVFFFFFPPLFFEFDQWKV